MEPMNTAAARALNALPRDETEHFDAMIEQHAYLADHVDSFRRVAVELADGLPEIVPAASPEIWNRIVDETGIYGARPTSQPERVGNVVPLRKRAMPTLLAAASVAAAMFIGAVIGGNLGASDPSLREVAVAAASQPDARTISMTSPVGATEISADVVITPDGTGYVVADALPALSDDRTYQLWLIVDDQVISAGLLGNDPDVVQFRAEGNVVGMAISNEVAGGVVVSEEQPTTLWLQGA